MTIDYGQARAWIGSVVFMRRGNEKSFDLLTDARDAGLRLVFQRTGVLGADAIDELRPVTPEQVAQMIVDENAAAGNTHDEATLVPNAGMLRALFPSQFAEGGEGEQAAITLLLTRTPPGSSSGA